MSAVLYVDVSVGCARSRRYSGRCCGGWQGSGLIPFLPESGSRIALKLAYGVVVCELLAISFIRYRFTGDVRVIIGGGIAFAIGPFGRIGVR
jgi:hypothetical protein